VCYTVWVRKANPVRLCERSLMSDHHNHLHDLTDDLEAMLEEPELIQESHHKTAEHVFLLLRNGFTALAAILFILSFFLHHLHGLLRGIGYLFGMAAYVSELGMLTDGFTRRVPRRELFMACCFGPLYLLMGLAYLLE